MTLEDLPHWEGLAQRVWAKVDRTTDPDGCWPWRGAKLSSGYGAVTLCRNNHEFGMPAHRVVYLLEHGEIGDDLDCCHHCDNRPCCRPDHLFAGTHRENLADMTAKGRRVGTPLRGEANGRARLTSARVVEVRRLRSVGESYAAIAARFGVSKRSIGRVVLGQAWKDS